MKNHFYRIRLPPLNVAIFNTDVCNCVLGATQMNYLAAGEDLSGSQYAVTHVRIKVVTFKGGHLMR